MECIAVKKDGKKCVNKAKFGSHCGVHHKTSMHVPIIKQKITDGATVKFYDKDQPYYQFSNFYHSPIVLDGEQWSTTEHYYQAQKFNDPQSVRSIEYMTIIRQADTPNKIFLLANQKKGGGYKSKWIVSKETMNVPINQVVDQYKDVKIRPDWEEIKLDVMRRALYAKFTQHTDLSELLVSTGSSQIMEDSPRDNYWGIGEDGTGSNWLGRLLMELRDQLKH